jgi:hypothetical protein
MRGLLRSIVLGGVACSLLLPIVFTVVLGLGALLGALGDAAGGQVCNRTALVVGAVWLIAVIATAVASGVAVLDGVPDRELRAPPRPPDDRV